MSTLNIALIGNGRMGRMIESVPFSSKVSNEKMINVIINQEKCKFKPH